MSYTSPHLPTCLKIYPTYAVTYTDFSFLGKGGYKSNLIEKEGRVKSKNNEMPLSAKRQLKKAISFLIGTSKEQLIYDKDLGRQVKFRCNFITLTLPSKQKHTDNEIKKRMLEPMLRWLRESKGFVDYIWKAERQKNGNLHFHISGNKYVNCVQLQNKWNTIVSKLGYMDSFYKQYGHTNPHSTEIKAVKSTKGLVEYLSKYISKVMHGEPIEGNRYAISQSLRNMEPICSYDFDNDFIYLHQSLSSIVGRYFHSDYFSYYEFKNIYKAYQSTRPPLPPARLTPPQKPRPSFA